MNKPTKKRLTVAQKKQLEANKQKQFYDFLYGVDLSKILREMMLSVEINNDFPRLDIQPRNLPAKIYK